MLSTVIYCSLLEFHFLSLSLSRMVFRSTPRQTSRISTTEYYSKAFTYAALAAAAIASDSVVPVFFAALVPIYRAATAPTPEDDETCDSPSAPGHINKVLKLFLDLGSRGLMAAMKERKPLLSPGQGIRLQPVGSASTPGALSGASTTGNFTSGAALASIAPAATAASTSRITGWRSFGLDAKALFEAASAGQQQASAKYPAAGQGAPVQERTTFPLGTQPSLPAAPVAAAGRGKKGISVALAMPAVAPGSSEPASTQLAVQPLVTSALTAVMATVSTVQPTSLQIVFDGELRKGADSGVDDRGDGHFRSIHSRNSASAFAAARAAPASTSGSFSASAARDQDRRARAAFASSTRINFESPQLDAVQVNTAASDEPANTTLVLSRIEGMYIRGADLNLFFARMAWLAYLPDESNVGALESHVGQVAVDCLQQALPVAAILVCQHLRAPLNLAEAAAALPPSSAAAATTSQTKQASEPASRTPMPGTGQVGAPSVTRALSVGTSSLAAGAANGARSGDRASASVAPALVRGLSFHSVGSGGISAGGNGIGGSGASSVASGGAPPQRSRSMSIAAGPTGKPVGSATGHSHAQQQTQEQQQQHQDLLSPRNQHQQEREEPNHQEQQQQQQSACAARIRTFPMPSGSEIRRLLLERVSPKALADCYMRPATIAILAATTTRMSPAAYVAPCAGGAYIRGFVRDFVQVWVHHPLVDFSAFSATTLVHVISVVAQYLHFRSISMALMAAAQLPSVEALEPYALAAASDALSKSSLASASPAAGREPAHSHAPFPHAAFADPGVGFGVGVQGQATQPGQDRGLPARQLDPIPSTSLLSSLPAMYYAYLDSIDIGRFVDGDAGLSSAEIFDFISQPVFTKLTRSGPVRANGGCTGEDPPDPEFAKAHSARTAAEAQEEEAKMPGTVS